LSDLDYLENLLDNLKKNTAEYSDPFYSKIKTKLFIKKYAIYAMEGQYDKSIETIELIDPNFIDKKALEKINMDRKLIEQRKKNDELKLKGDEFFKSGDHEKAKELYYEILQTEKYNEKVLSNLSLIYLNKEEYQNVIKYCTEIMKVIKIFKEKINIRKYDNSFEIKILLRRAKSYEKLNNMEKAQEDIEAVERLEIKNEIIMKDIKEIKEALKMRVLNSYKDTANKFLEGGNFSESLEYYNKALSLTKYITKIDAVKLYLNRCACLVKLGQNDFVINECSRILTILSKQKNIALINSNIILMDNIKNLEFITYVKRAYSYNSIGKANEAIQDYTKALEIKPGDRKIIDNLNLLKMNYK
jgi:tetratricopeptide (TPR) repeat protein